MSLKERDRITEKKYDTQFKIVFDAIRQLVAAPKTKIKKVIDFGRVKE